MNNDYIELFIKVPEEIYKHTQEYEIGGFNTENDSRLFMAIKNGIPLRKGHGALKDEKDLLAKVNLNYTENSKRPIYATEVRDMIRTTVSVIKADKESEDNE